MSERSPLLANEGSCNSTALPVGTYYCGLFHVKDVALLVNGLLIIFFAINALYAWPDQLGFGTLVVTVLLALLNLGFFSEKSWLFLPFLNAASVSASCYVALFLVLLFDSHASWLTVSDYNTFVRLLDVTPFYLLRFSHFGDANDRRCVFLAYCTFMAILVHAFTYHTRRFYEYLRTKCIVRDLDGCSTAGDELVDC